MTKHLRSIVRFLFFVPCIFFNSLTAQNVSVAGAVAGDGTYADLGTAFKAINSAAQPGATITISIKANTTELKTDTLKANNWKFLSIVPDGGAFTISGKLSKSLIHLNGASNVLIDGLNSGGNSLTFTNTEKDSTSTILFNNDCKNIVVQNCKILGSSFKINSGTLFFGAAAVAGSGNDMIRIKSCAIDSSSAGPAVNGIYSAGSVISGQENSTDSILNTSVANFFYDTLGASGVLIGPGNTEWTISDCRFYQSVKRTYSKGKTHAVIRILSGNANSILNNTIGYATVAGTGIYKMDGAVSTRFIAIDLSVGTTVASSVQGNLITAISLATTDNSFGDHGVLCGIRAGAGNVNIGNLTPNTIGGATGVDHITVTPSVTLAAIVGINSISTGTILIKNNMIGGLSSSTTDPLLGGSVYGIIVSASAASLTITENTIGNSTPDNMRGGILGTTAASSYVAGIYTSVTPSFSTISKNKIQHLSAYGSNAASYVRGIFTASATNNSSPVIVTENTITKLTSNSSLLLPLSGQTAAAGIIVSVGTNDVIADNVISDIALIGTNTNNTFAVGISHANGTNSTIRNNKISGITNAGTSTSVTEPAIVAGILIRSGTTNLNIFNNMISLGTGASSNAAFVGILGNHGSTPHPIDNIYHNTINITGVVASGAQPSFCFLRGDFTTNLRTQTVNIKNNIFTNSRSGGTGSHYAIANNYGAAAASATGWGTNVSNNNVLNANPATIGWWTNAKTFATWKGASLGDSASFSGHTVTYVDPAADLHISMGAIPNVMESRGQTIGSVTTDFDGEVRPGPVVPLNGGSLAPDIGADEFDGSMQDIIPPVITYSLLPPACDALDRTLTATIIDAGTLPTTGLFLPRVYYRKNKEAWVSSQGALTAGTSSNGTWTFPILTASMTGLVTGDSVSYFVIAQDISAVLASNPSDGVVASNVNTVTAYPTHPNAYAFNPVPTITTTVPASVCDSGKVTLGVTASAGNINWYAATTGGTSLQSGVSYTTPLIKLTTPYYVDATLNGCTSARVAVVATVNNSTPSILTTGACDSLKWNGKIYKISGTYKDTILTVKGCDSIMTLNLTINHPSTSTQTIKACNAYLWVGNVYTTSGVYMDTIPNKTGCDSLMTLNLTINYTTTSSESHIACNTYTWRGKTYTASGVYKDTVLNVKGCDSILSLNLSINYSTTSTQTINACNPYNWNGTIYNSSGTYKDTIPNKAGCDSLMVLNLTITKVNSTVTVVNNTISADSIADSYQWISCTNANTIIPGATGKSYTPAGSGSYAVIETKNGCVDTSICVPIVITGIAKTDKNGIRFYPNPGTGLYTLVLSEQSQIKIVSLTGAVVFDERLSKGDHTLDLLNITNGVYMMHVYTNETVSVLKLIKQ